MVEPKRIRLSRAKGFRLSPFVVNVARPGPLGNPFVVGRDGDRAYCVHLYAALIAGYVCMSRGPSIEVQEQAVAALNARLPDLRGKDVACWCALDGKPCHGDVILALANEERRPGMLDRFLVITPPAQAREGGS